MEPWQYLLVQALGMIAYGFIGVRVIARLGQRRDERWSYRMLDIVMAPYYLVAGVIAFLVIDDRTWGIWFLIADSVTAALCAWYARERIEGEADG